jgi:hypothetical protein
VYTLATITLCIIFLELRAQVEVQKDGVIQIMSPFQKEVVILTHEQTCLLDRDEMFGCGK